MKFYLSGSDLAAYYPLVARAVMGRILTPILRNVLITAYSDSQEVHLRATDRVVDVIVKIPADVESEGSACVDPIVFETASRFPEGPIRFSLAKRLTVSQAKRRHMFSYIPAKDYPDRPKVDGYTKADGESLAEAFRLCAPAISKVADRPYLQGFLINPKEGYVLASDRNQVSTVDLDIEALGRLANPPARVLTGLSSYLSGAKDGDGKSDLEVSFGPWTGLRSGRWDVLVNSYGDAYPLQVHGILDQAAGAEPKSVIVLPLTEVKSSLDLCVMYSDRALRTGYGYFATFRYDGTSVFLEISVPELADVKEPIEVVSAVGENVHLKFHPASLLGFINELNGETVEFRFFGDIKPLLVVSPDKPELRYLIVAVATRGEAAVAKKESAGVPASPVAKESEVEEPFEGDEEADF